MPDLPVLDGLTPDQLVQVINAANAAYAAAQQQAAQDEAELRASVDAAITSLATLLGPVDAPAGTGSINAVLKYDTATMGAAAGVALQLAFTALRILTETTLDVARVVGREA